MKPQPKMEESFKSGDPADEFALRYLIFLAHYEKLLPVKLTADIRNRFGLQKYENAAKSEKSLNQRYPQEG